MPTWAFAGQAPGDGARVTGRREQVDLNAASAYGPDRTAADTGGFFYSDGVCKILEVMNDEADLSAEQSGASTPPRLSRPDGNAGRPQRAARPPGTRPQEAVRITTLTARRDFIAANAGRRVPMPGFVLQVRPREDGSALMRIGYTVTRKIGNAVVRNRLKRRLRAAARDVLQRSGIAGADHVLIGRASGLDREFATLCRELEQALVRARR